MREIKFRAWDGKDMHQIGDLENIASMGDWRIITGYKSLMQYTGLKDQNGVEIYEGDILLEVDEVVVENIGGYDRTEPEGKFWEVTIRDLESGIVLINDKEQTACADHAGGEFSITECEVIGNIYENPELLTV